MAVPGATVIKFPPIYRIAYSDGDECGIVEDFQTRQFWQAECALRDIAQKHPDLIFWVMWRPVD